MANEDHVALLRSGAEAWNAWRATADVRPDLSGARLSGANLAGANLAGADLARAYAPRANLLRANLVGADLAEVHLRDAWIAEADLRGANLGGAYLAGSDFARANLAGARLGGAFLGDARLDNADLRGANLAGAALAGADLRGANLSGADLSGARLDFARLVETNLERSTLDGCLVYGASVWNVRLAGASQAGLCITPSEQPAIRVDDLEVAQFVYLLLNNAKLRNVIDTVGKKAVLLLGRFTPERKAVLDALHAELRRRGYLPILFDFQRAASRSMTETVLTLAGMVRFVIADLTDFASVPQELSAIAYSPLTSVPVQPILVRGSAVWSMYPDLELKAKFLRPHEYDSPEALIAELPGRVVAPAEQEAAARRADLERAYGEAAERRAAADAG
jgi:uncharacterized protein YjbI with pentapeptide repeats